MTKTYTRKAAKAPVPEVSFEVADSKSVAFTKRGRTSRYLGLVKPLLSLKPGKSVVISATANQRSGIGAFLKKVVAPQCDTRFRICLTQDGKVAIMALEPKGK